MLTNLEEIKKYLDTCIKVGRRLKKNADKKIPDKNGLIYDSKLCSCYIDTLQSVRLAIFDEVLGN